MQYFITLAPGSLSPYTRALATNSWMRRLGFRFDFGLPREHSHEPLPDPAPDSSSGSMAPPAPRDPSKGV
jgi:hypothetical protein